VETSSAQQKQVMVMMDKKWMSEEQWDSDQKLQA
jgi:hypothetical protein